MKPVPTLHGSIATCTLMLEHMSTAGQVSFAGNTFNITNFLHASRETV